MKRERVPRPRLCEPLPALPAPSEIVLTHHLVNRYIARHYRGAPQRFPAMHEELRRLVNAGEVVRHRPEFLPPAGRFERRAEVIGYAVIEAHGEPLALPLQLTETGSGEVVATTVLCQHGNPR